MQETLHDAVLRIDKVLKRKGWQDRLDHRFADSEPALTEVWKAARPSVATAGSRSPRLPTKPPSTGGRSATGRR